MTVTTIELSQSLVRLAEQYITARRRSGESLLEAAGYLAEARAVAKHGEWLPFLAATGTTPATAEQLLNIHERAAFDRLFAEAVKSNWLNQSTAALLARPSTPQDVIDQALTADAPPTMTSIREDISQARNTDTYQYLEDNEPLSDYEESIAAQYAERYTPAAPAVEYIPAPDTQRAQQFGVMVSSETNEWYTPAHVIALARQALGAIDLDPASCAEANATVGADEYFDADANGLAQPWAGRVWLNPPYGKTDGRSNQDIWAEKLIAEYEGGNVRSAVLLVKAALGYAWFERLWYSYPTCFVRERLYFTPGDGSKDGQAKTGTAILYFGQDVTTFKRVFSSIGRVILPED